MNLSRLMILGLLSESGPMHGHQIRRTGELTNAEVWGGITGGAIYAELRRLQGEGLVEPVREEQIGRRPARTVYEITKDGRLELVVQREEALNAIFPSADPVSVALLFAGGVDSPELHRRLGARRQKIEAQLASMAEERGRLTDAGVLSPMAISCFRRGEIRLDAELRWHDEFEGEQYACPSTTGAGAHASGGGGMGRSRATGSGA